MEESKEVHVQIKPRYGVGHLHLACDSVVLTRVGGEFQLDLVQINLRDVHDLLRQAAMSGIELATVEGNAVATARVSAETLMQLGREIARLLSSVTGPSDTTMGDG
jgi:hypothetical protein